MSFIEKRILCLMVLAVLTCSLVSSQNLVLNYYSTGTGQNITFNYAIHSTNSDVGFGLGWNINRLKHPDNQTNVFYKRQFATRSIDHLNLNLFYHRYILKGLENLNPFLFYDFQGKHSAAMNDFNSTDDERIYHGPYFWLDNTIGIGFNVRIFRNWYLQQKFGAGAHFILPSNREVQRVSSITSLQKAHWEFIGLLNIGILYSIK